MSHNFFETFDQTEGNKRIVAGRIFSSFDLLPIKKGTFYSYFHYYGRRVER